VRKVYIAVAVLALIMQVVAMFLSHWPFLFLGYVPIGTLISLGLVFAAIAVPGMAIIRFSKPVNASVPKSLKTHIVDLLTNVLSLAAIGIGIYIIMSATAIIDLVHHVGL